MQHRRIIRICDGKIHLNPTWSLSVGQTNLAEGEVNFRRNVDVFWEVEFNETSFSSDTLHVRVVNYSPRQPEVFNNQSVKEGLRYLYFKGIIWEELDKLLMSYRPNALFNSGIVVKSSNTDDRKTEDAFNRYANRPTSSYHSVTPTSIPQPETNTTPKPQVITKNETIAVRYVDAEFQDQQISFSWAFPWYHSSIRFSIANSWLKKEYDYIKDYFAKVIDNGQTFSASVTVTITDGVVTDPQAESVDISRIDKTVIDSIKYRRVLNLIKTPSSRKERSLFTTDDIFNNFDDNDAGNIFGQTEAELLNYIVSHKKVRNEQQLKCLASELHLADYKLRFTLNPLFGFVFYLPGRSSHFFCWELLESHATYLWSFVREDSSVDVLYDIVVEQISIIEQIGREQYKKKQRETPASVYTFISLEHTKINETDLAFENWKRKLDDILIN